MQTLLITAPMRRLLTFMNQHPFHDHNYFDLKYLKALHADDHKELVSLQVFHLVVFNPHPPTFTLTLKGASLANRFRTLAKDATIALDLTN